LTEPSAPAATSIFNRPGPHLVIRDFFGEAMVARLLDFAESNQGAFEQSGITNPKDGHRIVPSFRVSHRLTPITELVPIIEARDEEILDDVFEALGCARFAPSEFEIEMVAHGHGAFFKQHIDTLTGDTVAGDGNEDRRPSRVVSMVYYFCATPARFSGGQLRLNSLAASGETGTYVDIEPVNDTALFFPSWFPHEVLPVVCESGQFMDSRFAINCWVYK